MPLCKFYHSKKKEALITGLKYKSEPSQAGVGTETGAVGRKPEFKFTLNVARGGTLPNHQVAAEGHQRMWWLFIKHTACLKCIAWLQACVTFIPPFSTFFVIKTRSKLFTCSLLHRAHIWRFNMFNAVNGTQKNIRNDVCYNDCSIFYIKKRLKYKVSKIYDQALFITKITNRI